MLPPLDSSLPEGLALGALWLLVLGTVGSGLALGIPLTQFERATSGLTPSAVAARWPVPKPEIRQLAACLDNLTNPG